MNGRTLVIFASFALFSEASSSIDDYSFETCLKKDSISCLQIHVYKKLRAILSRDRIDLLGGFRIVKDETEEDNVIGTDLLKTNETLERQALLENFIYDKVVGFFKCRSLEWNAVAAIEQIAPTARQMIDNIPQKVRERMATLFNEGRSKKKMFKWFFPVIIAVKTTLVTWVKVIFVGVAFLAKKALVMSIIALTIAIFLAFKKHHMKEYVHPHHEIHGEAYHSSLPYYAPASWQPIQHGNYDSYDLDSSPSHQLAYSSQKPGLRQEKTAKSDSFYSENSLFLGNRQR